MDTRTETHQDQATPAKPDGEPVVTTRVDRRHEFNGATVDDAAAQARAELAAGAVAGDAAAIDAVHVVQAKDDVHTLLGATVMTGDATDDERSQLEVHARQLGRRLEARQAELDAREEELNRRLAELDQEMRRGRLWLLERRREIEEREVEIGTRRADLETRWDRLLAGERELQAARGRTGRGARVAGLGGEPRASGNESAADGMLGTQVEGDEADFDAPAAEFLPCDAAVGEAKSGGAASSRAGEAPWNAARVRRLEEAEALLASEQQAVAEARRRLEEDTVSARRWQEAQRKALAEERSRQQAALGRRHEALRQRAAQLDARAESLEQLRRDLTATERETLEMRVAVQELWLQLCGRGAPAAMLQSLAEARARLAAQYREAGGEFDAAEKRLRQAAKELAEQLAEAKEQRRQFQSWADERQLAIERQAARLVAREQELDMQEQRFRDQEHRWGEQRLAYRRQIRRLLAELRVHERSATTVAAD